MTKEGDDELLMIRKETPQPQPCGGFPSLCQTSRLEAYHLSEPQRPEFSSSSRAWLASSRNFAQRYAWLCLFRG